MWFNKKEEKAAPKFSCDEVEFICVLCVTLMGGPNRAISMLNSMGRVKRKSMMSFVNGNIEKAKLSGLLSPYEAAGYDLITLLSARAFVNDQSAIHIMKVLMMNGLKDKVREAMNTANDMFL